MGYFSEPMGYFSEPMGYFSELRDSAVVMCLALFAEVVYLFFLFCFITRIRGVA